MLMNGSDSIPHTQEKKIGTYYSFSATSYKSTNTNFPFKVENDMDPLDTSQPPESQMQSAHLLRHIKLLSPTIRDTANESQNNSIVTPDSTDGAIITKQIVAYQVVDYDEEADRSSNSSRNSGLSVTPRVITSSTSAGDDTSYQTTVQGTPRISSTGKFSTTPTIKTTDKIKNKENKHDNNLSDIKTAEDNSTCTAKSTAYLNCISEQSLHSNKQGSTQEYDDILQLPSENNSDIASSQLKTSNFLNHIDLFPKTTDINKKNGKKHMNSVNYNDNITATNNEKLKITKPTDKRHLPKRRNTSPLMRYSMDEFDRPNNAGAYSTNFSAAHHSYSAGDPQTLHSEKFNRFLSRHSTTSMIHTKQNVRTTMELDLSSEEIQRMRKTIVARRENKKRRKEFFEDENVLVGNKVTEGHVNYITAYNMLTGLRVSVSRCNAKIDRDLTDEDFKERHKLAFDISGNEILPSAKYDFKFKDYSPWVFRHLRALFNLDPADYLMSLTSKYIVSELGSPGKSGSFFYFSRDYRFIIKTVHHSEHKLLRHILKDYYEHVKANPNTLISQFYGLHRVKLPFGRKIHFIVMNNLFPPHRDIHRTYDLKGSLMGRETDEEKAKAAGKKSIVLKDLNWVAKKEKIKLGPTKLEMFLQQLRKDVEFLKKQHIMDYSLLLGIHDMKLGNKENIRRQTLSVFQPEASRIEPGVIPEEGLDNCNDFEIESRKPADIRKVINKTALRSGDALNALETADFKGRAQFLFYSDDGGFRATGDDDQPLNEIYYLGIIDCLTSYSTIKKLETVWRSLRHKREEISAIPPSEYGDRFLLFLSKALKMKNQ